VAVQGFEPCPNAIEFVGHMLYEEIVSCLIGCNENSKKRLNIEWFMYILIRSLVLPSFKRLNNERYTGNEK